jgi:phage terminase large subunit
MIAVNPVFKEVLTTDKRFILVTGGRASAKSFSINTLLCLLTYEKGHRILFTRYTLTSAELSIIPEFKEKIELLEVAHHFKTKKTSIQNLKTGTDVIFRGIKTSSGNQTASLKSIQAITTWVLEEAEELTDEDTFDTISLSIRKKGVKNRIIIVLNPPTKTHFFWEKWFKGNHKMVEIDGEQIPISTHPDVLHIHTTYLDNLGNLDEGFLQEVAAVKIERPQKYRHKLLGAWLDKAEGVVYENWREGEFDESLSYCYGLDPGYFPDPLALIRVAVDTAKKLIYWKEEMYGYRLSTDSVIKGLNDKIKRRNDLIVSDVNEPRLSAAIKKAKFNVQKAMKGSGSVDDGIRDIQDYTIIVDPDSQNLKTELDNYVWNDKKAGIPIDDFNHLLDGGRYAFQRLTGKRGGVKVRDFSQYRR